MVNGPNLYLYVNDNPVNLVDPWGWCGEKQWGPKWLEKLILPYGNYGGPANTDPSFQKEPIDNLDEIFMQHDKAWFEGEIHLADTEVLADLGSLPINPYRWKRKPKNILWAIIYNSGALTYFFWFSK